MRADDTGIRGPADSLNAGGGDWLPGGLQVVGRLGSGFTALALLVGRDGRDGRELALKIANKPGHNDRLRSEFGERLGDPFQRHLAGELNRLGKTDDHLRKVAYRS